MSRRFHAYVCFAVLAGTLYCAASRAADTNTDTNTTGLPTYPHDDKRMMDSTYRSIPNGQHCLHYMANTTDALADVEAWYKKQLPAAKLEDINKDSLYGNYFKLDGIKLLVGNDIVNVYRAPNEKKTAIEIFKCKDAMHARD